MMPLQAKNLNLLGVASSQYLTSDSNAVVRLLVLCVLPLCCYYHIFLVCEDED